MTIYFALKKGMHGEEFLDAIRGKVSGEGRGQVLKFMTDSVKAAEAFPFPGVEQEKRAAFRQFLSRSEIKSFAVLDVDTERQIALVAKTRLERDQFMEPMIFNEYFMMGTNDEGSYFVHPVNGLWLTMANNNVEVHGFTEPYSGTHNKQPNQRHLNESSPIPNVRPVITPIRPPSMKDLFAWTNRYDMGFRYGDRVQGDLLLKLFDPETWRTHQGLTKQDSTVIETLGTDLVICRNDKLKGYFTSEYNQELSGKKFVEQRNKVDLFNNHILKIGSKGTILQARFRDSKLSPQFVDRQALVTLIVGASTLVLEHEEHKTYTAHVPDGWDAVIMRQRGELLENGMERSSD